MRAEEEGSTPGWLMHCTWQVEDGVDGQQHGMIHDESVEVHDYSRRGNECFFYHFPSFDGVNTDVDESFPGISKAGVQCPIIKGSVACNG